MAGPLSSSVFVWIAASGVTALGLAWTLPLATRVLSDVLRVAWLVVSNVR